MSTGAECIFKETEPGKWQYWIQDWPYGEWPEGQINGPFNSFEEAREHLGNNYANPGGWNVNVNKTNHIHEFTAYEGVTMCQSCGEAP